MGQETQMGARARLILDHRKNDASVTLDLLRAVAAQMVCIGHGFVFFHVASQLRPPYFPYIQNIGVLFFFVMSGFLITATLFRNSENPDYGFPTYFVDRFARIYSALLPALVFVALVDWIAARAAATPPVGQFDTIKTFIANIFMLEGYRGLFPLTLQWPAFGSAAPLWTLAIEWHIYMLVGAVFFLLKQRGLLLVLIPAALFYGQTPLHFLLGAFQADGMGSGLFALWLGGASIYLLLRRYIPPLSVSVPALIVAGFTYAALVTPGHEYEIETYPALVVAIGSIVAISLRTKIGRASRLIKSAADYSFTLYLVHHTIITAIVFIFDPAGWMWLIGAVALSNGAAYLIARYTETRHKEFAAWLKRQVRRPLAICDQDAPASRTVI